MNVLEVTRLSDGLALSLGLPEDCLISLLPRTHEGTLCRQHIDAANVSSNQNHRLCDNHPPNLL
jgi:hypothetical protein